jgi:hypothetical protein
MSEAVKVNFVILWDSELRVAAKALREVIDYDKLEAPDDIEWSRKLTVAFNACSAALWHVDDDAALTISHAPSLARCGRRRRRA